MAQEVTIRLRLNDELTKELATYWEEEVTANRAPPGLQVAYRPAARPRGGLGLTLPPELLLTVSPELWIEFAKEFVGGAGGAIGAGLGGFLWAKIKEFLDHKSLSGSVKLSINEERLTLDPAALPNEPPTSLRKLDRS
jgi:hypothetical protein